MNVKNNEHGYRNRSEDASSMTDAVINKLLAKYNLNKVADDLGIHNFPMNNTNPTTSENKNAFQKKNTKDPSEVPHVCKKNIDDIFKRYSINYGDHEHRKDPRDSVDMQNYRDLSPDEKSFLSDSAFTNKSENTRNMDANLAFLKSKITIQRNKNENYTKDFYYDKAHAEKTTYCRTVCNIYNEEFIYKTLERNAKLQALLKKLILDRRREKEKEEWNNYINELKNKYNPIPRLMFPEHILQERCFIEPNDIYKINQTQTSKILINDFGYANPLHEIYPQRRTVVDKGSGSGYVSENELYCYPTATQGRAMVVEGERKRRTSSVNPNPPPKKGAYVPKVLYIDMSPSRGTRHISISEDIIEPDTPEYIEAAATQTPEYHPPPFTSSYVPRIIRIEKDRGPNRRSVSVSADEMTDADDKFIELTVTANCSTQITVQDLNNNNKTSKNNLRDIGVQISQTSLEPKTTKEKYDEVTNNVNRLKAQIEANEQKNQGQGCMRNIESKLDSLAKSINNLIAKMKKKSSSTNTSVKESQESKPKDGADEEGNERNGTLSVGYVETNTSTTAFQAFPRRLRRFEPTTMIDDIISEELEKSNRLRRELGELLHTQTQQNHSVQITFDIPTRERATEVTDSLPRTDVSEKEVQEMSLDFDRSQMTIAVNTEPLGLLALLTMSSVAMRQLMSYVPAVDYGWYLSRLLLPQRSAAGATDFVCNICGASFARPSQLSDHMRNHDFGKTKDCCVCRHALDLKRRPPSLFACRYCGQRFTRAYCCELHQQTCARALGLQHDVQPSLTLLR